MPLWAVAMQFLPKKKMLKLFGIILVAIGMLIVGVISPIITYLHVPLADKGKGHILYYKEAVADISEDYGVSLRWQDLMMVDAVLLNQNFARSSRSRAYSTARDFVREEEVYVDQTCTRDGGTDEKGNPLPSESYDCSYWETRYYARSFDEALSYMVEEGRLKAMQVEDVKRYAVLDWPSFLDDSSIPGPGGGGGSGPYPSGFAWPVPNIFRITSPFGYRTDPITGAKAFHDGLDVGAKEGTPVVAAKSGQIIRASAMGTAGNTVIIDHGGGIETRYYHLSSIDVYNGDTVEAGQQIGAVGSTGRSTGPHLHFIVRISGEPIDPSQFY